MLFDAIINVYLCRDDVIAMSEQHRISMLDECVRCPVKAAHFLAKFTLLRQAACERAIAIDEPRRPTLIIATIIFLACFCA